MPTLTDVLAAFPAREFLIVEAVAALQSRHSRHFATSVSISEPLAIPAAACACRYG